MQDGSVFVVGKIRFSNLQTPRSNNQRFMAVLGGVEIDP
jgi:hypothetical protein